MRNCRIFSTNTSSSGIYVSSYNDHTVFRERRNLWHTLCKIYYDCILIARNELYKIFKPNTNHSWKPSISSNAMKTLILISLRSPGLVTASPSHHNDYGTVKNSMASFTRCCRKQETMASTTGIIIRCLTGSTTVPKRKRCCGLPCNGCNGTVPKVYLFLNNSRLFKAICAGDKKKY